MLLEFRCSNHRSIKEEVRLSMVACSDDSESDHLFEYDDYRILPVSAIYGANGSGKSNVLGAMAFMKSLVVSDDCSFRQIPHKLATDGFASCFLVQFWRKGNRYAYGLSISGELVSEEYLYFFPNGKEKLLFRREGLNVEFGNGLNHGFETALDRMDSKRLFLSCAACYSQSRISEEAFLFFKEDLVFPDFYSEMVGVDIAYKDDVLVLLNSLGTGIRDVVSRDGKLFVDYGEYCIPYDEESAGIRKLIPMLMLVLKAICRGKVLIWDDIDTFLHQSLLPVIIKLFQEKGSTGAQLIFTTHDSSLLSSNLFRRDEIWFTELLGNERATELYSLSDTRGVRKSENLEKGYISGRYGAVPRIM